MNHPDWRTSGGIGVRFDLFVIQKLPLVLAIEAAKVSGVDDIDVRVAFGTFF